MAKIIAIQLESIPETINVGDDITDIIINTQIEFHKLDISIQMEYMLYLFVYDVHGNIDVPVIIGNWDESEVMGVSQFQDRKDHLLGQAMLKLKAKKIHVKNQTPIALELGKLKAGASYSSRKLEVFATLIPANGRASKWSEPFEVDLIF